MHTLSIEKMAAMYISLQEIVMHMQSEMYSCKETMEMQKLEIKALREELHAMKNMTI